MFWFTNEPVQRGRQAGEMTAFVGPRLSRSGVCEDRKTTGQQVRQYRPSTQSGLTLVQLLVQLALSAVLLATFSTAVVRLLGDLDLSTATSEVLERGYFGLHYVQEALALAASADPLGQAQRLQQGGQGHAWQGTVSKPCALPQTTEGAVLGWLFGPVLDVPPCVHLSHALPDSQWLLVQWVTPCDPLCDTSTPYFQWQAPSCDRLFLRQDTTVVLTSNIRPPTICSAVNRLGIWRRSLFYLRDYASTLGDGIPTLMELRWRAGAGSSWLQAQQLVTGTLQFGLAGATDTATAQMGIETHVVVMRWSGGRPTTPPPHIRQLSAAMADAALAVDEQNNALLALRLWTTPRAPW